MLTQTSVDKKSSRVLSFSLVSLLFLLPGMMQAGPIYSCPDVSKCNGNEYAVTLVSQIGNTYQLELDIHVLGTYTGNQWTDVIQAVQLKDFASSFTNASLISGPGGAANWGRNADELSANGCTGGSGNKICSEATSPYAGAPVSAADIVLSWVFQFDTTGGLNDTVEVKYLYADSEGNKILDLGGLTLDIQGKDAPSPPQEIPEPSSFMLIVGGLSLLGVGRVLRRRSGR